MSMSLNNNPFTDKRKTMNEGNTTMISILPKNKFHSKNKLSSFTLSKMSNQEENMIRNLKDKQAQFFKVSESVDELIDENDSLFKAGRTNNKSVMQNSNISQTNVNSIEKDVNNTMLNFNMTSMFSEGPKLNDTNKNTSNYRIK